MNTPTYLNGLFLKKIEGVSAQGEPYEFFKMGVKRDEVIKQLQGFPVDEQGFVNFKINQQRGDASKYSTTLDTWKPNPSISSAVNKQTITANGAGNDSLPF